MSLTIVYGSAGGYTRKIARQIAYRVNAQLLNIKQACRHDLDNCPLLILGCPADLADQHASNDWDKCLERLEEVDLTGKTVALFGSAEQKDNPANFLDAIGTLYAIVAQKGARVVGVSDTSDCLMSCTAAQPLANPASYSIFETHARINAWLNQLIK